MEKKFMCPCGLICCDCLFYKDEIYKTASKLKELIKEHELDKFLINNSKQSNWEAIGEHVGLSKDQAWDHLGKHFDIFKQMPAFMSVLDGIIELQCKKTCQEAGGCSISGNVHECIALKCIKSKEYEGCWQCSESENCENLRFLKNGYGNVIEDNLNVIRQEGIEAVKSYGNKYYAWQRKNT